MSAQIKVDEDGNIGLGTVSPTTKVHIYGRTIINPQPGTGGFVIDTSQNFPGTGYVPTLRPSAAWWGSLGNEDEYFATSYVQHMFAEWINVETGYYYTGWSYQDYEFSDENIKTNIKKIEDPFSILNLLEGKKYDLNPKSLGLNPDKEMPAFKDQYGFIAQEFMEVLPELVGYDSITELLAINYTGLIPIIVEALKNQQSQINDLAGKLEAMQNGPSEKSTSIESVEETITTGINDMAEPVTGMKQNVPNPFSATTTIDLYIATIVKNATVYVYNMQGVQIMAIPVPLRGTTSVTIDGNTLEAGMYLYALVADNKEIDTKKMILTK